MLPYGMQNVPQGVPMLPTKAQALRAALAKAGIKTAEPYVPTKRLYHSLQDALSAAGSAYNSLLGSLSDVAGPANPVSQYLRENTALYDANATDFAKRAKAKQAAEMAGLADDDYLGIAALTAKQAWDEPATAIGKAAGNLIGAASTGIVGRAIAPAASAVRLGQGMSALYGAGAAKGGAYDAVKGAPEEALAKDPEYVQMAQQIGPEAAREAIAQKRASYLDNPLPIAASTVLSGAMGGMGADPALIGLLSSGARGAARDLVKKQASQHMLAAGLKTLAKEGASEFVEEGSQTLAGNLMAGSGGAAIDPMSGVIQAGTEGALMSMIPGAAAGPLETIQARQNLAAIEAQDADRIKRDEYNKAELLERRPDYKFANTPPPEVAEAEAEVIGSPESSEAPVVTKAQGKLEALRAEYRTRKQAYEKTLPPEEAAVAIEAMVTEMIAKKAEILGESIPAEAAQEQPIATVAESVSQPIETTVVDNPQLVAVPEATAPIRELVTSTEAPTVTEPAVTWEPQMKGTPYESFRPQDVEAAPAVAAPVPVSAPVQQALAPIPEAPPSIEPEAVVKTALESGKSPYESLVAAGMPANDETRKLANKTAKKVGKAIPKQAEPTAPVIQEAPGPDGPPPPELPERMDNEELDFGFDAVSHRADLPDGDSAIAYNVMLRGGRTGVPAIYKALVASGRPASKETMTLAKELHDSVGPVAKDALGPGLRNRLSFLGYEVDGMSNQQVAQLAGALTKRGVEIHPGVTLASVEEERKKNPVSPHWQLSQKPTDSAEKQPSIPVKTEQPAAEESAEQAQEESQDEPVDGYEQDDAPPEMTTIWHRGKSVEVSAEKEQEIEAAKEDYLLEKQVAKDSLEGKELSERLKALKEAYDSDVDKIVAVSQSRRSESFLASPDLGPTWSGFNAEQRKANEAHAQKNPVDRVAGADNLAIIDPEKDTAPESVEWMRAQGKLGSTLKSVHRWASSLAGVSTTKFRGFSAAGTWRGVNFTYSPGGDIYLNPLASAKYAKFNRHRTAEDIVDTIIHELAHEKKDNDEATDGHSEEIFGKELKRLIAKIGPQEREKMIKAVYDSLDDMDGMKNLVENAQGVAWDEAGDRALNAMIKAKPVTTSKVSLGAIIPHERRSKTNKDGAPASSKRGDGKPARSEVRIEGAGKPGPERKEGVSGDVSGQAKGLAKGSNPNGGNGNGDVATAQTDELPKWGFWEKLNETWLNRYNRIDQIQKGLGDVARALVPQAVEEIRQLDALFVEPIADILQKSQRKLDDLDLYARAMQAPVRNLTIMRRGGSAEGATMTTEKALEVIKQFKDDKVIKEAHDALMAIAAKQRNILVNSGLVSGGEMERAVKDMGPYYVPLHHEELTSGLGKRVGGVQVTGKEWKAAEGTEGPVKNVVGAMVEQTNRTIVRAHHNYFMQKLAKYIAENPSKAWSVATEDSPVDKVVEYREEGETRKIQINDAVLRDQIKGMKPQEMAEFFNSMRSFTHFYSKINTKWNPIFPLTNFIRDTPLGISRIFVNENAGMAGRVFKSIPKALAASWSYRKNRDLVAKLLPPEDKAWVDKMEPFASGLRSRLEARAEQLLRVGGVPSWQGMQEAAKIKSDIEDRAKAKGNSLASKARNAALRLGKGFEIANDSVETGMRLAYFDELMGIEEEKERARLYAAAKKTGNKPAMDRYEKKTEAQIAEGEAISDSLREELYAEARKDKPDRKKMGEIMEKLSEFSNSIPYIPEEKVTEIASKVRALTGDFQAHGTASRYVGALYPFFNASAQGMKAVAELMIKAGKGDKKAIALFTTLAAVGMSEDILNAAFSGDDDDDGISDYDAMPDWMKRQKFIIPATGGKSVMVPMTYGLSIAVNMGKLISRATRGTISAGDFAKEMTLAINESNNPLGGGGSFNQMLSPAITDWAVQIGENKDWRGDQIYPDRLPWQEWKPSSEVVNKSDSLVARKLAKLANAAGGGDELEKGALGHTPFGDLTPYPGAIDATFKWAMGGLGRFVLDAGKIVAAPVTGEEIKRVPIYSTFISSPERAFYIGRFYEQLREIKEINSMSDAITGNARRAELSGRFPNRIKEFESANHTELKSMLPHIKDSERLKRNFARIGVKKLELMRTYDALSGRIKKLEVSNDPKKDEKIMELVLAINKRFVEASK